MKTPVFKYVRVDSIGGALSALAENRGEAKILAGGQSLVPMLNFRIASPSVLVDINPVKELDYIRVEEGWVRIGARTRQRALDRSMDVKRKCPLLAEVVKWIGHPEIRTRGTVGGSLVHADPTAELALVAILLDSQVKIQGNRTSRTVGAADFFQGIMATSIAEDEILTEVSYPVAPARSGYGFQELCIRHGDFAVVAAAVQLTVGGNGRCTEARVAVAGAGPTPLRIRGAEEVLVGNNGTDEVFDAAAARVPGEVQPFADLQGSEAYRREMARVFVRRALDDAWSRLKENH